MPLHTRRLAVLLLICLAAGCTASRQATAPRLPSQPRQAILAEFTRRLPASRQQIPAMVRSAEAMARRTVAHPELLINAPYWGQAGFAEELINRAGGLSNIFPTEARPNEETPHDFVLYSVRSWEKDGEAALQAMRAFRDKGHPVTLFASRAGAPADVPADYFIDNGAPGGGAEFGSVNAIVNSMNSWMWCAEYVGAMSRRGRAPGVLLSAAYSQYEVFDGPLQKTPGGRQWVGETFESAPPGALAEIYWQRAVQMTEGLASPPTQRQVALAAHILADRVRRGGKIAISGIGHLILLEMLEDHQAPWTAFSIIGNAREALEQNLAEGDLLLWIGYVGMNSAYENYAKLIRDTRCDLIVSAAFNEDLSLNGPWALAFVEQDWELPDAEVPIPAPPGRMSPISGVNANLLFRMIDEETASRLRIEPAARPSGDPSR